MAAQILFTEYKSLSIFADFFVSPNEIVPFDRLMTANVDHQMEDDQLNLYILGLERISDNARDL